MNVFWQVGDASMDSHCPGAHGMTGTEWKVATALFTAGEVKLTRLQLAATCDLSLILQNAYLQRRSQSPGNSVIPDMMCVCRTAA